MYLSVELLDFLGFWGDLGEVGFDGSVKRLKGMNVGVIKNFLGRLFFEVMKS